MAGPAGHFYVYGDSYSDISPGHQKTNGPVWSEHVAQQWNLDLKSFATYGTRACRATDAAMSSIADQVDGYIKHAQNAKTLDSPTNVHAFFVGVTDITNSTKFEALTMVGCLKQQVATIQQKDPDGQLLLLGLPPLDNAPFYTGDQGKNQSQKIKQRVDDFNAALEDAVSDLKDDIGDKVAFVDNNFLFAGILGDPAEFGMQDVEHAYWDQCQGRCADSMDDYLWWDSIHLTGAGHRSIANTIVSNNPFGHTSTPDTASSVDQDSWLPAAPTDAYLRYAPALLLVSMLVVLFVFSRQRHSLASLFRVLLPRSKKHKYEPVPV
ncbi:hypothetical protein DM01DRAFT_325091 [Hesseltinella vesiculosa]|uniref:SGNH hydrolase n=1 Tax=Hesseltinella vesiculosa TaxID=101127 RepID=A0A1X2GMQ5_9FUNG|nr:hypothetical protein DM01DRAFT_325091 [Hesseltinella vesiculosa]